MKLAEGAGFEPAGLSPAELATRCDRPDSATLPVVWCRSEDSNLEPPDLESGASASWARAALPSQYTWTSPTEGPLSVTVGAHRLALIDFSLKPNYTRKIPGQPTHSLDFLPSHMIELHHIAGVVYPAIHTRPIFRLLNNPYIPRTDYLPVLFGPRKHRVPVLDIPLLMVRLQVRATLFRILERHISIVPHPCELEPAASTNWATPATLASPDPKPAPRPGRPGSCP